MQNCGISGRFGRLAAAALAAFAAAEAGAAIRAVTPAAWNGDTNCWQMARHCEKLQNIVTNGGAQVVFIGDSITHFWETHGKATWQKFFAAGPRRALNLGTSADRTEHVLWRLTEGRELDGYEAKCILLMIGTNNTGHFPIHKEPPIDTICGIRKILDVIAAKQPNARIILSAVFPRSQEPDEIRRRRNSIVNKAISKFADGKRIIWCDFTDKFLAPDGRLARELFPDLLHPGARGYEMWAGTIVPLIDRVLSTPPDEAIPSVWPSLPATYNLGEVEVEGEDNVQAAWWRDRCLAKRNEIVDGPGEYDLVMMGDSITHNWEALDRNGEGLYAEMRKNNRILNLGYGGDRIEHLLWRAENGELEGYKAKCFTVMIGTNNGQLHNSAIRAQAEGIGKLVRVIREKHPESKVLLHAIFPRGSSADDEHRAKNDKLNAVIQLLADGKNVIWIDLRDKLLAENGEVKGMQEDRLHLDETGYAIWREALAPYLAAETPAAQ